MKKFFITLIVLAVLGATGWYGYHAFWGPPPPPVFQTAEVARTSIISTVSATGTIEPTVKVLVGSQVSGTVMRWYADFNQSVEKNFVLAELDQDRYKRTLDQREASVAVARANADQAEVKYREAVRERSRLEPLYQNNMASEKELLDARGIENELLAAWNSAKAQILAAEAERKAANVDLDKTIIRAPIDGVVISRDIDEGQTVAASLQAPTLFTIAADLKKMRVNANVSEQDIGEVREGMAAEFVVDAYPGRKFRGCVGQVRYNPTITENVVTYTTLIDVTNDDLALRPGMTATIAFEVARADDVLAIPNAALRFKPGQPGDLAMGAGRGGPPAGGMPSLRINPASAMSLSHATVYTLDGGKAVPVQIAIGLSDVSRTQITGDLREGMPVIIGQSFDRARPNEPSRGMTSMIR